MAGRRGSSSSRTADNSKEPKKEEKASPEDPKSDDVEEINYKEMLNR